MIAAAFDRMIRPRNAWEPLRIPKGCTMVARVDHELLGRVIAAKEAARRAEGMDDLLAEVGTKTWR